MLANTLSGQQQIGFLSGDIPKPASFRHELLDFIADALPVWRDRTDRNAATSETVLTSQVCAHLNSASRHAKGWDILQFRVEEADEQQKSRKVDIVAAPSGTAIIIEGRRHVDFDPLLPIECKRLPIPKNRERDEREYVFSDKSTTGGIQRFKAGYHGAGHRLGAMIAYVQDGTVSDWNKRIGQWIESLAGQQPGWTTDDLLHLEKHEAAKRFAFLRSFHVRGKGLEDMELCHLWIEMN